MAARTGQRTGSNGVVTRRAQQVQTVGFQTLTVAQHVNHLAGPRFLGAAQRLLFQSRNAARFVTRRWVLVDRLIVSDKVLFEVVHHSDGFFKRGLIAAVAHQDLLGTKHLRHLGQHGSAAVTDHVVREAAQHRVGGDAREAIGAAALETKLQLAQLARFAFIVTHRVIELVHMLKARFHFVFLVLADHKVDAVRVEITQRFAEHINLVVLTAETNHQHRTRVRVAHHVLQHSAGVDVIVPKLGAAVGVAEQEDAVGAFSILRLF